MLIFSHTRFYMQPRHLDIDLANICICLGWVFMEWRQLVADPFHRNPVGQYGFSQCIFNWYSKCLCNIGANKIILRLIHLHQRQA